MMYRMRRPTETPSAQYLSRMAPVGAIPVAHGVACQVIHGGACACRRKSTKSKIDYRIIPTLRLHAAERASLQSNASGGASSNVAESPRAAIFSRTTGQKAREFDHRLASLGNDDDDLDEHRGKLCLRRDPLSCRRQANGQHDLSLSILPQVGRVARRCVADLLKGGVPLHSRAAFRLAVIRVGHSNILCGMWDTADLREHRARLGG